MSVQSVNLIWVGYWPTGDVYPSEPVWSESHATVGVGVDSELESLIHADFIIPYGLNWSTTIDLVELEQIDTELTPLSYYTYVKSESVINPAFGWNTPLHFAVDPVMDVDGLLWTGAVTIGLDVATQGFLGFDRSWRYQVRSFVEYDGVPQVIYIAAGQVVVRR